MAPTTDADLVGKLVEVTGTDGTVLRGYLIVVDSSGIILQISNSNQSGVSLPLDLNDDMSVCQVEYENIQSVKQFSSPSHISERKKELNPNAELYIPKSHLQVGAHGAIQSRDDPANTTIFIWGLKLCVTKEMLKKLFTCFGIVVRVEIPDQSSYGFIQFAYRHCAELALSSLDGLPFGGRRIQLSWATPSRYQPGSSPQLASRPDNSVLEKKALFYDELLRDAREQGLHFQVLAELLLQDDGIDVLLGRRGAGKEGVLGRFLADEEDRQQFLLEAAQHCDELRLYDKAVEIRERVWTFARELDTINKCLSEAISTVPLGRLDGESRSAGLVYTGNALLQTYKYYSPVSPRERERVQEQQTVLRQLEAILSIHTLARPGHHGDALREVTRLSFFPLDPHAPYAMEDVFQHISPHVQACIPNLLTTALTCLDNVMTHSDGSLCALRVKIASILVSCTNHMK